MSDQRLPPPTDNEKTPPAWADTSLSRKEESLWGNTDKLRGIKEKNDQIWHICFGWIAAGMMIFFTFLFAASLLIWMWHQLTPWVWLTETQLSKVQSIIFSGSIGAIVSSYMQKQLQKT